MVTTERKQLKKLEREVKLLRSAVIGLSSGDPEGRYRSEFVREILSGLHETPRYRFTGKKDFLAQIRRMTS